MFITGSLKLSVSGRCQNDFRGASVLSLPSFQVLLQRTVRGGAAVRSGCAVAALKIVLVSPPVLEYLHPSETCLRKVWPTSNDNGSLEASSLGCEKQGLQVQNFCMPDFRFQSEANKYFVHSGGKDP